MFRTGPLINVWFSATLAALMVQQPNLQYKLQSAVATSKITSSVRVEYTKVPLLNLKNIM